MPLISILIVILSLQKVPWPEGIFLRGALFSVLSTWLLHGLCVLFLFVSGRRLSRIILQNDFTRSIAIKRYQRVKLYFFWLNLVCLLISLLCLGWGWSVWNCLPTVKNQKGELCLIPWGECLVILPYLLTILCSWLAFYPVEKAIRETSLTSTKIAFYSATGYFFYQLRNFTLFVLFPGILSATHFSFNRLFPVFADSPYAVGLTLFVSMLMIFYFPLIVPFILGLISMYPGELRNRLELTTLRCGFRFRDIKVWPTRSSQANAMVMGVIPSARYLIFTDRILDLVDPDELDAICGHEIGHVVHGHIPFYGLFLFISGAFVICITSAFFKLLDFQALGIAQGLQDWLQPISIFLLICYMFVVFGYISRQCERQADIFGAKAVSCNNPKCDGHDDLSHLPDRVQGLCPTGIRIFSRALDRVAGGDHSSQASFWQRIFEKVRNWQHGPANDRIAYLYRLINEPEQERQFQTRFFLIKLGIMFTLLLSIFAMGWWIGWEKLLSDM